MKRLALLVTVLLTSFSVLAQKEDFSYDFYGFVRGDLFYNSRSNVAPVDGNFYLFPLGKSLDANGKDLNKIPNSSFYTFTTRLGMNVKGPDVGSARTTAKIETDFGGYSTNNTMLRIRQAYVALDWTDHQLLLGQTWHPLFGSVIPSVLNLSTGAPFNPFNRSPQVRYQYTKDRFKLTTSAIWQLQYLSTGPNGKSEEYIKNSCIPELYFGMDYSGKGWLAGAGVNMISIKPRQFSSIDGKTYKVDERMTALSYEAHVKYAARDFSFAAKSILASSLDHSAMLGGYGISKIDDKTGEQEYTPFRHSTSWVNVTYGSKWVSSLFLGFSKNLGTDDALKSSTTYGLGLDIDKLFTVNASLSYKLPHWQFGVEYCPATAWYGTNDLKNGKVYNTYSITNHRILALLMYNF
jgi:hypothetical protein